MKDERGGKEFSVPKTFSRGPCGKTLFAGLKAFIEEKPRAGSDTLGIYWTVFFYYYSSKKTFSIYIHILAHVNQTQLATLYLEQKCAPTKDGWGARNDGAPTGGSATNTAQKDTQKEEPPLAELNRKETQNTSLCNTGKTWKLCKTRCTLRCYADHTTTTNPFGNMSGPGKKKVSQKPWHEAIDWRSKDLSRVEGKTKKKTCVKLIVYYCQLS